MKEPVDKLIKDKLYDHESAVPNHLWEQVSAGLESEEKKKPVYWYWAAVILFLFGTSLLVLREPAQVEMVDNGAIETQIDAPVLASEEKKETKEEETLPQKEALIERRQLVAPMLTALDSRALALSGGDQMELSPADNSWVDMIPEYKEEGRILVRVQLASHTADEVPEEDQKKSWRDRIDKLKNTEKKIRIPKPNISLANMFAAK